MEAISISKRFVSSYEATWSSVPEDRPSSAIGDYPKPGHIYIYIYM
jgi:hypothetical protein